MNESLCHDLVDQTREYYEFLIRKYIEEVGRSDSEGSTHIPSLLMAHDRFTFQELETLHRLASEPD